MTRHARRTPRLAAAACLALLAATPAPADDQAERLDALRARLTSLQRELAETRGERDRAREALRAHDQRIGELNQALRGTERRLQQASERLGAARRQAARERTALADERAALARAARAAHRLGRQDRLKLLLSQDDPARAARVLTYYRYLSEARAARLQRLTRSLERLAGLERAAAARGAELAALRVEQDAGVRALAGERAERARLVAGLNREVMTRAQEIERLRADQARLERLVGELRRALPPAAAPAPGARFAALKGRLPLPARGTVLARFGETKGMGDLRWRGILLAGREGEEVTAVAGGRVVFADWLRGFGLLLILDHGDGYMTLYGHNLSLGRVLGDRVEAGEVIAAVGTSGDAPRPGLYFEIRHDGEPQDPLHWCRSAFADRR